jgi:transketolase
MAAAMNGMALHGGIVPYSGTFLIFPITAVRQSGSPR